MTVVLCFYSGCQYQCLFTNVCRYVDPETSNFEMIDTHEDEWVPAKGNSDVDEEEVIPRKTKKEKKKSGECR